MSKEVDDFLNSGFGGFIYWAIGISCSILLARFVWYRITATPGFFRVLLGALAWAGTMAVALVTVLLVFIPFTQRSDFRKKTDSALKAIEHGLENESRELSDAQRKVKNRIAAVRTELRKLN